eukprot:gene1244-1730_t
MTLQVGQVVGVRIRFRRTLHQRLVQRDRLVVATGPRTELGEAVRRKGSFLKTMQAVAWSFFGVRKSADYEKDVTQLNPVHVVIAGVIGALLLIAYLQVDITRKAVFVERGAFQQLFLLQQAGAPVHDARAPEGVAGPDIVHIAHRVAAPFGRQGCGTARGGRPQQGQHHVKPGAHAPMAQGL